MISVYFNTKYTMTHIVDPNDIGLSLCGRRVPYKASRYNALAVLVRRCKICQKKLEGV